MPKRKSHYRSRVTTRVARKTDPEGKGGAIDRVGLAETPVDAVAEVLSSRAEHPILSGVPNPMSNQATAQHFGFDAPEPGPITGLHPFYDNLWQGLGRTRRVHFGNADLSQMARDIHETHFKNHIPVHRGGSFWSGFTKGFSTVAEAAGTAIAGTGLAITPIAPEFGLPMAAIGGISVAVGEGVKKLGELGGSLGYDAGHTTLIGGGVLGDIGGAFRDVGKVVHDAGRDVGHGIGDAANFMGLNSIGKAMHSIPDAVYGVGGDLIRTAGDTMRVIDRKIV